MPDRLLHREVSNTENLLNVNKQLTKLQEEIKTLFENIEVVFFSIDLENYVINQMSSACKQVYGYAPEEFGNNLNLWYEVIHPDDKYLLRNHEEYLAQGLKLSYQYRIIHKDGSVRWLDSKIIPTVNKEGKLVRIDGIANDITEKKLSEKKISQAERLLSEAQHLAKLGNWNVDLVRNELFCSEELRRILGIDRDYVLSSEEATAMIYPEDRDNLINEINRISATGETLKISFRIIRKGDGEIRTVDSVIGTAKSRNGTLKRIYGITRDVTLRTKLIHEAEQNKLLLYQISHDLRSPLNSAKNYIYLAQKRVNNETANMYLAKIHDAYNKMEHRILSLLDIQRLNMTEVHLKKISLKELIGEIIGSIDGLKGYTEVDISLDINVNEDFFSNKQYLHSIIHNLIINAITHRRNIPDAYIRVSAHTTDQNLVIVIADNGTGIPAEMKSKVFEKFVKGDSSVNGTGLGLYIVKNLVKKLKGTITFESELMEGTTFTITFPALHPEE